MSVAIFALLPANAIYFATILYTTENVGSEWFDDLIFL